MTTKELKEAIKDLPDEYKIITYDTDYDIHYDAKILEVDENSEEVVIVFGHNL